MSVSSTWMVSTTAQNRASGMVNTSRMVGATLDVAILGTLFAAYAGQDAVMGAGFLPGLHAAMSGSAAVELLDAVVAFAFIRSNSLQAETSTR